MQRHEPPLPGLEWDPDCEAWVIKDAPDGRRIWVMQFMFTGAIIIGPPDTFGYDDRWCYATLPLAATCAQLWDGAPGTEPGGWHRHPRTGRRRPGGSPVGEYVNP